MYLCLQFLDGLLLNLQVVAERQTVLLDGGVRRLLLLQLAEQLLHDLVTLLLPPLLARFGVLRRGEGRRHLCQSREDIKGRRRRMQAQRSAKEARSKERGVRRRKPGEEERGERTEIARASHHG